MSMLQNFFQHILHNYQRNLGKIVKVIC
jgi:hypothetical protein